MMAIRLAVMAAIVLLGLGAMLALFAWWTARRIKAALPPQGRFIIAGDVRFHVHEEGEGPPLLLIHGLAGQMRHYTYGVSKRLSREFRVVSIDRPGSGYSERPSSMSADLSAQAAAIASLIDAMQLGPVCVAGHSLGGAIALTLAVEHPRCVSALALIAPLTHLPSGPHGNDGKDGNGGGEVPAAFRALTISSSWLRTLFAWTLAVPASIAGSRTVLDQVFGPEPVPRDFGTRGGGLMSLFPHQFIAASRDIQAVPARLPAIAARYGELRIPVRVLFGREDRILDWKVNGEALAGKVAGAQLELVEGGHMLPVTKAELTAAFIRESALQASEQAAR
ncbi:alpha/beta fold hydrolase [Noviherbaspirillum sp. CPCC 100848]|uniref:Alpha/beta fold hydrolase n=1 Tax=Noviherbaspirillum album TaxID=3080276 RepID=A0ABU6J2D8_9BURK|nr:alpha/beta fold hydrolase [Noviherbaspirillum sp. CPCC 100848]MEC4717788.1 alpha/beta fold hydrolase [Noviherbaspirillum sp. CPCC 100848]